MSGVDPKYTVKELIENNIDSSELTKDNGDGIRFAVMYGQPPEVLVKDFFVGVGYDALCTVGRATVDPYRHLQNVPLRYNGKLPVDVWVVKKTDIDGHKLRWKFYVEIRSIFRSNATYNKIGSETDNDRIVAGKMVYNSTFTILHDDFV